MSANLLTSLSYNSMSTINFRKLKIHTKYRIRNYDKPKIPEIRIEGKWLESTVDFLASWCQDACP